MENQLILPPIHSQACPDFPIVQYADDTLLIMQGCNSQLLHAKSLLRYFAAYTGLKVNYSKSNIIPINISQERIQSFSVTLGCNVGTLPFSYLGMPLSLTKPKVSDFMIILQRISSRLAGCSTFLSYGEKLVLIKSVFTSLPIFFLCTLPFPVTVLQQINKYLRHCFWRKYGMEDRRTALIAWEKVCKPKQSPASQTSPQILQLS